MRLGPPRTPHQTHQKLLLHRVSLSGDTSFQAARRLPRPSYPAPLYWVRKEHLAWRWGCRYLHTCGQEKVQGCTSGAEVSGGREVTSNSDL